MSVEFAGYGAAGEGNLVPLLARLSSSPEGSSGAWRLGSHGRDVGVVLMERGRVCWAAAVGLHRRLTDLIVQNYGIEPSLIERTYAACRDQGKPLGECLVGSGILSAEALEVVLMQHTTEAIRHVAELKPDSALWIPHSKAGYAPRYTFSLSCVFARATAISRGLDPVEVERQLGSLAGGPTALIAYSHDRTDDFPVGIVTTEEFEIDALMELGRWARRSLSALTGADSQTRTVSASTGRGMFVVIDTDSFMIVALCPDGGALARFLAHRARGDHGHLRPQ